MSYRFLWIPINGHLVCPINWDFALPCFISDYQRVSLALQIPADKVFEFQRTEPYTVVEGLWSKRLGYV
jgi:hypothetical protein